MLYPKLSDSDLLTIQKPAQYLGGEVNSVIKTDSAVSCCLAFPDTYEIGMSHLGIQILYEIINSPQINFSTERAFMPFPDFEALLRKRNANLCSLETKTPLKDFDLLGFSLQYELCGTNILAMLELGGIEIFANDRGADAPLIIGGGPVAFHPDFLLPFFDAFFIGDGEEAILEILEVIEATKKEFGDSNAHKTPKYKSELLGKLSDIRGIYVPSVHGKTTVIKKRFLPELKSEFDVKAPIVPSVKTVHNRLSIEIMRGCGRSCRFCQAGFIYRPIREKAPNAVLKQTELALNNSGFEELSLLSLSTADYCNIVPLTSALMDCYAEDRHTAVSFPSTRVDALSTQLLNQVERARKTAFTIAPEGGSQRLRDIINKQLTEEQILNCCETVFSLGWKGIKMYFMIGLPTETDEDIAAISALAEKVKKLPSAKGKNITVSVSTFVPKPHTPFQWAEQIGKTEILRKQQMLKDSLRRQNVTFRYQDAFSSVLEGIFARGNSDMASLIVSAYKLGCRLDAWHEYHNKELWEQAFAENNISIETCLRQRELDESLPWDNLSCGIPKSFFKKEYLKALQSSSHTPNCLDGVNHCAGCGICGKEVKIIQYAKEESLQSQPDIKIGANKLTQRIRIKYRKLNELRLVGHLEIMGIFIRAAKRAKFRLAYSQGFHPHPKIAFSPPVPLGMESYAEYADLILEDFIEPEIVREKLSAALPASLQIEYAASIAYNYPSINDSIKANLYNVVPLNITNKASHDVLSIFDTEFCQKCRTLDALSLQNNLAEYLSSIKVIRKSDDEHGKRYTKSVQPKQKEYILSEFIPEIRIHQPFSLEFKLLFNPSTSTPKTSEIVESLLGLQPNEYAITKTNSIFDNS